MSAITNANENITAAATPEVINPVEQLRQALAKHYIPLQKMQEFFGKPHKLKVEAGLERNYTPNDEMAYLLSKPEVFEKIKKSRNTSELKEVALETGLYYLFKYLYIVHQLPLTLTEYNKYFPKTTLQSHGPNLEKDEATVGSNTKVTLDLGGTAFMRQQRIMVFFEEIKVKSDYRSDPFSGARWRLLKQLGD